MEEQVRVPCPLCKCADYHILFEAKDHYAHQPGAFTVVQCSACAFVYTNPRPSQEALAKFYPDEAGYYQPEDDIVAQCQDELQGRVGRMLYKLFGYAKGECVHRIPVPGAARLYRRGYPHCKPGGRLLEVGCAYGRFLYQQSLLGWQVEGVELNQKAVDFARNKLGLNVQSGLLETVKLSPHLYDCVVMRMVLEHLPDPLTALKLLNQSMKMGGEIIIAVPNFDCFATKMFKQYAYFLHVPQHMSHFTPSSIRRILELGGFRVRHIQMNKSVRDMVASAGIQNAEGAGTWLTRLIERRWFQKTVLKIGITALGLAGNSSRMMIYAEKTDELKTEA